MKVLKSILIVLGSLIALLFIIALFVPKSYTVSVSETIAQPRHIVFDYVRVLDNQRYFSVWVMEDPDLVPVITGRDGEVGAVQSWDSDKVGAGEQEIIALTNSRMEVALRFFKPFEGTAQAAYTFTPVSEFETKITTEFHSTTSYPMNLMSYLFGKRMIEASQKQNLKNIKEILEQG